MNIVFSILKVLLLLRFWGNAGKNQLIYKYCTFNASQVISVTIFRGVIELWYSNSKGNILGSFTDADTSKVPKQLYRKKNASFCLKVGDALSYDTRLVFKRNLVVNNNQITEAYKHRVNYSEKNIELCLHNLSESDSGIYKLSVVKETKINEEEYHLVVQGECFLCVLSNDRIL